MDGRDWVVCHVYAFIWAFTHIMIFLGIWLIYQRQWILLALYIAWLSMGSQVKVRKMDAVSRIFIPALQRLFGGCEIIRNDIRSRSKTRPVMYAVHPHAIAANGFGLAMHDCARRGERITVAASSWLCCFNPLFRWFINAIGLRFTSVRRSDFISALSRSENIALLPGGFEEVLFLEKDQDVVCIQKRFGFLKLAIQYGYDVVPIFIFGESKLYSNLIPLPRWVRWLSATVRMPLVIPSGCSWYSFMPNKPSRGLRIVFGEALHASEIHGLRELHRMYVSKIQDIYKKFNLYEDTSLVLL